ncbi:hypothetical protein SeLEV6574_g08555 [Synchytrium endobioticum]|uniref:Uncharacterized protein n=1 Tax=Synchytrium endobioticum TaxID=286115 RepID=A0A507BVP4_9FUNG|nr:hypothetical protein SeLEV6574_g08555 [Synchytrium endobioticum]
MLLTDLDPALVAILPWIKDTTIFSLFTRYAQKKVSQDCLMEQDHAKLELLQADPLLPDNIPRHIRQNIQRLEKTLKDAATPEDISQIQQSLVSVEANRIFNML